MRISTSEIPGLISGRPAATTKAISVAARRAELSSKSGREIARVNELQCVAAVAKWGHLRIQEIARVVWPSAKYAEQLAARTVRRLVKQGLLLERRNALGGRSFCLTRPGAAWLEVRGIEAQQTLELSVTGATFFHRIFATRFLIERQISGQYVAGEYQILRRNLPFKIEALTKALRKFPDGFCWSRMPDGTMAVEWAEQEVASKARGQIENCLRVAAYVGTKLPGDAPYKLSAVVFVFDGSLSHARRILLAANSLWGNKCPDLMNSYTQIGGNHLSNKSDEIQTKSIRRELQTASRSNDPIPRPEHWSGLPGHEAGRVGGETLAGTA